MNLLSALFPKARAETLRLLFGDPGREVHLRDLARLASLSPAAMQKELAFLVELGLVRSRRDGNRLYFQADAAHTVFPELHSIVMKTSGIATELQQALAFVPGIELAFIFGSVAAGTSTAASDVDVLIIGSVGLRKVTPALREVSTRLSCEINPRCMTSDEWLQKKEGADVFVKRVLSEPKLWLKGGDHELGSLGKERLAASPSNKPSAGHRPAGHRRA
jgi:predicted nucleotidyltransferase